MSAPLVPLVLLWMFGLFVGERLPVPWQVWLLWCPVVLVFGWWGVRLRPLERGVLAYHAPVYGTLLALACLLGAGRGAAARPDFDLSDLASYNDLGWVTVRGTVARYPEAKGEITRYEITAHEIEIEEKGVHERVKGRFLVNLNPYPAYQYGDELVLSGELVTPPVLEDFDYRAFLAHKGIYSLLKRGRGFRVAEGRGSALLHVLFGIRRRAEWTVQRILPEPHASLMSGILLGIESGIPEDVMEAFNTTGTTHIIVISGSNFAILAGIFLFLGRKLFGEKLGTLFAIVVIALYALLVGGDPPVLRAAIMGVFSVFALLLRRQSLALNILALTVLIMTAAEPGQLYDVGFQLSALATLGLVLLVDPITGLTDRLLARYVGLPEKERTRLLSLLSDALLITLAAQFITTPLIVGTFGRFSVVSLLTNLLILPVQGGLLTSGGLATLAGLIWLPLGQALGAIPFAALEWTIVMVRWTATFPYASVTIGPFPTWYIWWLYALGGVWWWQRAQSKSANSPEPAIGSGGDEVRAESALRLPHFSRRQMLVWGASLLFALLPWWVVMQLPDGQLHLYVLDVGQGDAILIVAPDGKQILVDGGRDPVPLLARLGDQLPPWDRTIEVVVLTHADADHLGGLPELLNRYEVSQVMDSGFEHTTALYEAWRGFLGANSLVPQTATPEQRWHLGQGAFLEVLAPRGEPFENLNSNSVVLRVRYGKFCALLTGDIEAEAEKRLVESDVLGPCQVLKAAHHGSKTSSIQAFLDAVRPSYALISLGRDNRFGHPHPEVIERYQAMGMRIFRTDQQGTIHITTDGSRLWVETQR
ncbi:MAG: DNA internalization-related competence protein ComEC/Rec2 [Ardenticatenaceae bacterium]